jgi:chromate transporter
VIVLARRSVTDLPTSLIALATLLLLFRWKIPEPVLIVGSAAIGLVLWHGK